MNKILMVRFGEIGIKGGNRSFFVNQLIANIKTAVKKCGNYQIKNTYGRIYLYPDGNIEDIIKKLKMIPGIVSISPATISSLDFDELQKTALQVFKEGVSSYPCTFKVETRRANKEYFLESPEISSKLGAYILKNINKGISGEKNELTVDVHNPEHLLQVEVRKDKIYVFNKVIPGPGGLPVGSASKGLLLLSGGIDSPVAGWLSMKRGIVLEGLYFHSHPYTGDRTKEKVVELAKILSAYGRQLKLHICHFTDIQLAIQQHCPRKYNITIMRRMMFRLAERIARKNGDQALITGESVGQVASQTLESMHVINEVTNLPVLRPLISMDKTEIMRIAREIGTYETSILPYEDCCTIFVPEHPVTKPKLEETLEAEKVLETEELIKDALDKSETMTIGG